VVYFTPSGSMIGSFGSHGTGPGQFYSPQGVDVSSSNIVYVTDINNHNVQYFTSTGGYLGSFMVSAAPFGQSQPVGITTIDGVMVYVSESNSNSIKFYNGTTDVQPASLGIIRTFYR